MRLLSSGRNTAGFTLFELMITVSIIAFLLALALPSFEGSIEKGRRADAQAKLREFEVFAARRFTVDSDYSCFAEGGDCDPPANDDYYTYSVALANSNSTFTITATPKGSQADDKCGTMTLNQAGAVTAGHTGCWPGQSS